MDIRKRAFQIGAFFADFLAKIPDEGYHNSYS